MGKINSICFIADGYPNEKSVKCVFVQNLVVALADMGIKCYVIAPCMVHPTAVKERVNYYSEQITPGGNIIKIYRPYFLHLSSGEKTISISLNNHYSAVMRTLKRHHIIPDAFYGHFIYMCGVTAVKIGLALHKPSYIAVGEVDRLIPGLTHGSNPYQYGREHLNWADLLANASGVICVSTYVKELLIKYKFMNDSMMKKAAVIPNAVDTKRFYPRNRTECRKKMGFPEDVFIIAYNGTFNDKKGSMRVSDAISRLKNVYSIFIGRDGDMLPTCENILFVGRCPNDEIPEYLSAADIFVLPTKYEGCCNAIVEAVACGLPIVSSDRSFNDDIISGENSIRINPESVDEIANAIRRLQKDIEFREKLSRGSVCLSEKLSIANRAKKILNYMEGAIE